MFYLALKKYFEVMMLLLYNHSHFIVYQCYDLTVFNYRYRSTQLVQFFHFIFPHNSKFILNATELYCYSSVLIIGSTVISIRVQCLIGQLLQNKTPIYQHH